MPPTIPVCIVILTALTSNKLAKQFEEQTNETKARFEEQTQLAIEIKDEIRSNHHEMQQRVNALETENMSLTTELAVTKDMVLRLQEQVNNNYLIFNGIPETPRETPSSLS